MRFRDDTRGVTVQVGAVLLFATIIIALSVYQATVVPAENADVEYRHSQQVQGQLVDVRNALVATAETGDARPATVSLGTEYPNRVFLVNPPPPAGTLRTNTYDNPTLSVSNLNATNPETRDYLSGTWSARTKSLSYVPGYNEYRDAPRLRYEASVLSNYYPEQNTSVPLTDQLLVDEETKTVSLMALNGSLSTSRSSSVAVDPEALSAPSNRVQVKANNSSQPVNVTIPTVVDASVLRNSTSLDDNPNVTVVQDGPGRVTLSIDWSGPFTLRTAKVGVGSDTTGAAAHYLTLVESDRDSVTVEARDVYNNPVSGELVSANRTSVFEDADGNKTTNENGRATFDVADGAAGTTTLEILGGTVARERVPVNLDALIGGTGGDDGAYRVQWLQEVSDGKNPGLTCDASGCTLNASEQQSVTLVANSTPTVEDGLFRYSVENKSVGTMSPGTDRSDQAGESSTTFSAKGNGTSWVYVSSGGSGDRLDLTVENYDPNDGGNGGAVPQIDFRLDDTSLQTEDSVEYVGSYAVSTTNGSFQRVEVEYENLNDASATQTLQKQGTRGGLRYTSNYGAGDSYEVTVRVIYDDGGGEYVAASRTVTDVADAENPSGNDDLSTSTTATLVSSTITDRGTPGQGPRYQFDYAVSTTGGYSQTELVAVSTGGGAKASALLTSRTASKQNVDPSYGYSEPFKLAILVYGPDGAVVDDRIVLDTADGNNP